MWAEVKNNTRKKKKKKRREKCFFSVPPTLRNPADWLSFGRHSTSCHNNKREFPFRFPWVLSREKQPITNDKWLLQTDYATDDGGKKGTIPAARCRSFRCGTIRIISAVGRERHVPSRTGARSPFLLFPYSRETSVEDRSGYDVFRERAKLTERAREAGGRPIVPWRGRESAGFYSNQSLHRLISSVSSLLSGSGWRCVN